MNSPFAMPRTVVVTESGLIITRPEQISDVVINVPAMSLQPNSAGVSVNTGLGANRAAVAYTSDRNGNHGLSAMIVDYASGNLVQVEDLPGTSRYVSEPIVYSTSTINGFFAIRESGQGAFHELTGCILRPAAGAPSGVTCGATGSIRLPGIASNLITPVTVYVSGSPDPDLAVVTADPGRGRLSFYRPQPAATGVVVNLSDGATATPAVSTTFLSRYNMSGSVMFIPVAGGAVEIVGWTRPNISGPGPGALGPEPRRT